MILPITVQGDDGFIIDVLQGLVAQYDAGILPAIASVLVVFGLLVWSVKYSMDNEKSPHPFKELIVSLLLVGVFILPGTSPRFDVQIVPINKPLDATVVERVPFIAAVPAWAASNLIGVLTRDAQVHFGDVYGTNNTLSQMGMSPFEALVHMHSVDLSGMPTEKDLNSTIDAFIQDCYVTASQISNITVPKVGDIKGASVTSDLWTAMKPHESNWLTTTSYLDNEPVENLSCRKVHTDVTAAFNEPAFQMELTKHFSSLGVELEQVGWLPQVLGDFNTPTPTELMIGRFMAARMSETLGDSQLATAFGRGVFEAQQQRVYQRAGEANMFLQVAKPMITTLEAFVFFIAPIMMLLAVMGGVGLSYVGKYLMILLFTNLWSYIAVFVSALNTRAVANALQTPESSGLLSVDAGHILSFGAIGNTITEIEGGLVVAATMVAAIPMLAMFLLYGGVHSLMGVMGKFGGTYDGKSSAPPIVSTGPTGERVAGDYTDRAVSGGHTQGSVNSTNDTSGVNFTSTQLTGTGQQRTNALMNSEVSSAGQQVMDAVNQDMQAQSSTTRSTGFNDMDQMSYQNSMDTAKTASEKVSQGHDLSGQEAVAFAAHAGIGVGGMGFKAGAEAKWAEQVMEQYKSGETISVDDQEKFAEAWNSLDSSAKTEAVAQSEAATSSEGFSNTQSASNAYQAAQQEQKIFAESSNRAISGAIGTNLNGQDIIQGTNQAVVDDLNDNLTDLEVKRLRDEGLGGIFIPNSDEIGLQELRDYGGINAVAQRLMQGEYAQNSDDMRSNLDIASKAYKSFAENTGGASGAGVMLVADQLEDLGETIGGKPGTYFDGKEKLDKVNQVGGVGAAIDDGKARIKAKRDSLDGEYNDASNKFKLDKGDYSDRAKKFQEQVAGRAVEHDNKGIAPIARNLSGREFNSKEDKDSAIRDAGTFAGIDSGYGSAAGEIGRGLVLLSEDTDSRAGFRGVYNGANKGDEHAQFDLRAMQRTADFLATDNGKEFFSGLSPEIQESVADSYGALRHMEQRGGLDFMEDINLQEPDSQRYAATQKLYDHATQGSDLDAGERYKAYQASNFVSGAAHFTPGRWGAGQQLSEALPESKSDVLGPGGLDKSYARDFISDNLAYLATMEVRSPALNQENRFTGDAVAIATREKYGQELSIPNREQPEHQSTPAVNQSAKQSDPSAPSQVDEFQQRVRQEAEINRRANEKAAREAKRNDDGGYTPPEY